MMAFVRRAAVLALMLCSSIAAASPCAALEGDATLVDQIGGRLHADGIKTTAQPACTHVRVAARGDAIEVARDDGSTERVVGQLDTAVTLIESWTRTELEAAMLAPRPEPEQRSVVAAAPVLVPATPRVQALTSFETAYSDDRSNWVGVSVGACVEVGPVCASVRARVAAVVEGRWESSERHQTDVVVGGEVSRSLGPTITTFGFGAGMGATHTGILEAVGMRGSETFGLRADAHASWTIPFTKTLALDFTATMDVAQVTDVETSSITRTMDEPRFTGRFGAGLRYGER